MSHDLHLPPWISFIFDINKVGSYFRAAAYYRTLNRLLQRFVPARLVQVRKDHWQMTREKAMRRWQMRGKRSDLVTRITDPDSGITLHEFIANSTTLAISGSDTTSTVLSGVMYYLVKNPEKLRKLEQEVRSTFSSEEEINITTVNGLSYMLACPDEAMRIYPPVAGNLPHRTRIPEQMACGFVPADVYPEVFATMLLTDRGRRPFPSSTMPCAIRPSISPNPTSSFQNVG